MSTQVKQSYLTSKNFQEKIQSWKQELVPFSKHWKPFRLEDAALLVIDFQRYFLDPSSHAFIPSAPTVLPSILRALKRFRAAKRPVFFTRFAVKEGEKNFINDWWQESVEEGTQASELISEIRVLPGEKVIRKIHYSAFKETALLEQLKSFGVNCVLIAGVHTHLCCESTARDAFEEGLNVFILLDGTASSSESLHLHSLQSLSHGFATPLQSSDL